MTTKQTYVRDELDELTDVLSELSPEEWDGPSACDGFRVCDVAAHLALAHRPVEGRALVAMARGTTTFSRFAGVHAVQVANETPPEQLLAELRERVAHPRAGFFARIDRTDRMLADYATHLQDVRVGVNRRASHDAERARAVLAAAVQLRGPVSWSTRERSKGLRLIASDVDWAHGEGAEVRGPYDGLLLAIGGRPAGLALLEGEGVASLATRMPG